MSETTPDILSFEEIGHQLSSADLGAGVAEIHGMLCGLFCGGCRNTFQTWVNELFEETDPGDLLVREAQQSLGRLYRRTKAEIDDPELGLSPFLPGDEATLERRATALSEWCGGFLYGLGLTGLADESLSPEAREALDDISRITQMDLDDLSESEDYEIAYAEVLEYVWITAMLIYEDVVASAGRH